MVGRRALAVAAFAASCGRIDFGNVPPGGGGGGGGGGNGDGGAGSDSGAGGDSAIGMIVHQSGFAAVPGPGRTEFIPVQATAAGDAVVITIGCAGTNMPTAAKITAPGWTFTELVGVSGTASGPWAAAFGAIAPDANAVTATGVFTVSSTCQGSMSYVGDVFSDSDASGGTMTFDGAANAGGSGTCDAAVTTGSSGESVWAACLASTITAAGSGYTLSQNSGGTIASEYEMTNAASGTVVDAPFASSGTNVITAVAIRPL